MILEEFNCDCFEELKLNGHSDHFVDLRLDGQSQGYVLFFMTKKSLRTNISSLHFYQNVNSKHFYSFFLFI